VVDKTIASSDHEKSFIRLLKDNPQVLVNDRSYQSGSEILISIVLEMDFVLISVKMAEGLEDDSEPRMLSLQLFFPERLGSHYIQQVIDLARI
jgi:hypothetical protein